MYGTNRQISFPEEQSALHVDQVKSITYHFVPPGYPGTVGGLLGQLGTGRLILANVRIGVCALREVLFCFSKDLSQSSWVMYIPLMI